MADPETPPTFGTTVRKKRVEKGYGLRQFSELVGMSPTYLSKVERDDFDPPSEEKVVAIARLLDLNEDELLALAGRVASDLEKIIQKHPREMATFLRAAGSLSSKEIVRLTEQARKRSP